MDASDFDFYRPCALGISVRFIDLINVMLNRTSFEISRGRLEQVHKHRMDNFHKMMMRVLTI
jgi:hypothetical protein